MLAQSDGTLAVTSFDGPDNPQLIRIADFTGDGKPDMALACAVAGAAALGMSDRSFRRRLGEEGTSFRELLDRVRYTRAKGLLQEGRQPVEAIALLKLVLPADTPRLADAQVALRQLMRTLTREQERQALARWCQGYAARHQHRGPAATDGDDVAVNK